MKKKVSLGFGREQDWTEVDFSVLPTPCYVVDEELLEANLVVLENVVEQTGCKILLALKGFAMWHFASLSMKYLDGVAASSLYEARLGAEMFRGEVHTFATAFRPRDFPLVINCSTHLIFNSFSQWFLYRDQVIRRRISCGLRVNPANSEVETALYDPCGPCSRLGILREHFYINELDGISGLHFHNLCECGADALERTLEAFENRFGEFLSRIQWVNFGGGHHITREDYDVNQLVRLILGFRKRYPHLQVYLEPGEAIALNTGVLVTQVLDIVQNNKKIAILDTSAEAHMPDVLAMPYRPRVIGGDWPGRKANTYRLAGCTCLAGDVIGDYSFDYPLQVGDQVVFLDMAHYTMVKNNTFNGIPLPDIIARRGDTFEIVKRFSYEDYKRRLS